MGLAVASSSISSWMVRVGVIGALLRGGAVAASGCPS
jgi:hypothetical protein